MGEDLFAQKCMELMVVSKQENFGLTTGGSCEADHPAGQEKNKNFTPNCAGVSTPSIHPFKTPEAYTACWAQAASVQPRSGLCDACAFPLTSVVHLLDWSRPRV